MSQQTTLTGSDESEWKELYFDGSCKENPGPMGYGFVLKNLDGPAIEDYGHLGNGTNNKAEYQALLHGLKRAIEEDVSKLIVKGDSEVIIRQVSGEYSVDDEGLQPLHAEVKELERKFSSIRAEHIPREKNGRADELADRAFD